MCHACCPPPSRTPPSSLGRTLLKESTDLQQCPKFSKADANSNPSSRQRRQTYIPQRHKRPTGTCDVMRKSDKCRSDARTIEGTSPPRSRFPTEKPTVYKL